MAPEVEMWISLLSLILIAVSKAKVVGSVKAAHWLMPLGVGKRLVDFGVDWIRCIHRFAMSR